MAESVIDTEDASDADYIVENIASAEGCEVAVAEDSESSNSSSTTPNWWPLSQRVEDYRNVKL